MAIIKHGNNALSNVTAFPSAVPTGKPVLISSATASSSASIEFTSRINSTYPIYKFKFINMHSADAEKEDNFLFQGSTNTGSSYGVTITSTFFWSYHDEADTFTTLAYYAPHDLAQSTSFQILAPQVGTNASDKSCSGELTIFEPSSTTFVKHFIAQFNTLMSDDVTINTHIAGYFNTTSAVDAFQFKFNDANIESGTIKLYGIGN